MSYKVLTYAQLSEKIPELITLGTLAELQNLQKFMDIISDFQLKEGLRFVQLFRGGGYDVSLKVIFEEWANDDNLFLNEEVLWGSSIENEIDIVKENHDIEEWYEVRDSAITFKEYDIEVDSDTQNETFSEEMSSFKRENKEKGLKSTTTKKK
jgi:hypothetical protein